MKAYLKLLPLMVLLMLMLMLGCSDDGSENSAINVTLQSQSITEGAEVDAASTTQITLTYNVPVKLSFAANITLNDKKVEATSNATSIVIPVQLEEGTSYTLQVQTGSVVAVSDAKASAPSFTLKFKTTLADIPQTGTIPTKPLATSPEAVKLYQYLYKQYGRKVLSSVMANVNWNNECAEKVYQLTGKYPAMNCYDFIHICFSGSWINYEDISPILAWTNAGGLVQLMWHFNVPKTQGATDVTCTPNETTFRASNALKDGTWENMWFYQQMDKVVRVLLKLQNAGIAATWRPFHEAAGNATAKQQASWTNAWFWWGNEGADTYKKLWHTMYDYFKQEGVNNLIWVWTTQNFNGNSIQYNQDTAWYPGDNYVDMVARDLYGYTAAQNAQEFREIQEAYPNKMVALGECGYGTPNNVRKEQGAIADCWQSGALWSHFMVWYQGDEGSTGTMCNDDWWKAAMNSPYVITRDLVDLTAGASFEPAATAVRNMGLGWNLGNTLDSNGSWIGNNLSSEKYETAWGQPVTKPQLMTFLKREGFNAIRVPVTWWQHLDANNNIDESWMKRVQEVVDYVIDAGMYCILNVHHDTGAGDENWMKADLSKYDEYNARFVRIWEQIAQRFNSYGERLVFEGYNEMVDAANTWNEPLQTSSYTALNQFAQSFVNTVRATGGNNAQRNLVVNTYAAANGQKVLDNFTVPTDPATGHLIAEIHTYGPWNWFKGSAPSWNTSCSNELKNMLSRLNKKFISKGIPVIIGEYGTNGEDGVAVTASSNDVQMKAAADQAADIVAQAKALGVATFYWMGLINDQDRNVPKWTLPVVVEAMKKAYNN